MIMEQDGADAAKPASHEPVTPGRNVGNDEKVAVAAAEVAWLEVLCQGLKDGTRSWTEWDESLGGEPDRTEIAITRCEVALERAREVLRGLTRSGDSDQ
jgi:hypothetical protein